VKVDKATSNLTAARTALADAQRQAAAADEARQQIRSRVATGDAKVRGADLADADQAVDLAGLRLEAAAKNVELAERAHRQAEHDQLLADIDSLLAGTGRDEIAAQLEKVDAVLQALADLCDGQHAQLGDIVRRAVELQPLPTRLKLNGARLQVDRAELSAPNLRDLVEGLLTASVNSRLSVPPELPWALRGYVTDEFVERYQAGA
jgi:hypothetical protein